MFSCPDIYLVRLVHGPLGLLVRVQIDLTEQVLQSSLALRLLRFQFLENLIGN